MLFQTHFIDNKAPSTLFVFHGMGGGEMDFLESLQPLFSLYNVVGLRGNTTEHGQRRFFLRHPDGSFDQESLQQELKKLFTFLEEWHKQHQMDLQQTAYLGYSNGANFILNALLQKPQFFPKVVLLHGRLPTADVAIPDLSQTQIFASFGSDEPFVSAQQGQQLFEGLEKAGAQLKQFHHTVGHRITFDEWQTALTFLKTPFSHIAL
jgi:phospholipase/carboxylesterase